MLKKIILSVIALVLLTGSESMFANERNAAAGVEHKKQVLQSGVKRARQQEFDRYFNALTKAYRENDREKMGQMLRKMNQFRQNHQKAKVVSGRREQDLPKRRSRDMCWHGRGKGRRGRGMGWHGRGMGGRGRGMCWHGRGMGRRGRGMGWHGRSMSRRGRGMCWHGRSMSRRGRGIGWRGRGMGGRGQSIRRRKMKVSQRDDMPGEEFDWDW
ncbi:MAG: hypothetical protein ACYS9Y_03210 [Planctomycetota bacterium]